MRIDAFPTAAPEDCGVSSEAIRDTIRDIRETNALEMHSFLLLRNGVMLWEEYFRQKEAERLHPLYSVSKSFLSTAMGLGAAQGLFSLDDRLYDFFPEYGDLCDSEWKRAVSLRHLLMMGSGFENNERAIFAQRKDFLPALLAQPVIHAPGTVFNYYTGGSYLLSAAFQRANPEGIHAYLKRKLFAPMQITRSSWQRDPEGTPMGGFGLSLAAYDLTKLGQLYLQDGLWEGQQLLPTAYVREATAKQIDNSTGVTVDWQAGYGFQFWRNAFGGFRADGMHGQYIVVLPEKALVVVMTSKLRNMQIPLTAIAQRLLPAVR